MIIAGGRQLLADTLQLCLLPFFPPLPLRFFSLVREEKGRNEGEWREGRKDRWRESLARSIVWLSRDNSIDGPDTWVQSLKGAPRSLNRSYQVLRVSLRPPNRVLGAARKSNASPNVPISSRLMFYRASFDRESSLDQRMGRNVTIIDTR